MIPGDLLTALATVPATSRHIMVNRRAWDIIKTMPEIVFRKGTYGTMLLKHPTRGIFIIQERLKKGPAKFEIR